MEITKTCTRCHESLPLARFNTHPKGKFGLRSICKACQLVTHSIWRKNNFVRVRHNRLRQKFQISLGDYNTMLFEQGYVCAICLKPETMKRGGKVVELSVDHDRSCCPTSVSCGKCVRGLLCYACNTGIGRFNDDVAVIDRAIRYISKYKEAGY